MSSQPSTAPQGRLLFGPFEFDESSGELLKHGIRIRLRGQPLQILAVLVRQPGDVVTRSELQQQLWSGSTFVDFEHGLNAAMNRLREALADSSEQPRYIETLPGRGYRFIAAVQPAAPKTVRLTPATTALPEVPVLAAPQPPVRTGRTNFRAPIAAVTVVLALLGGYVAGRRNGQPATTQPIQFSIVPPNGFALEPGSSRQTFALSPDGSQIAFSAMDDSGRFSTFIRKMDSIETKMLPGSEGSYAMFWAPDGPSLFLTLRGAVRRSGLAGDSYQTICDTPAIMLTGAVSGQDLLISGRTTNYKVPLSGGTPQPQKDLYPWPQFLPDGKHLLYTIQDSRAGHHRARVVTYGRPETVKDLVETDSRTLYTPSVLHPESGYLVYVRAGTVLAQPFDPRSLEIQGEPVAVVSQTYSFVATAAADISVSNNGLLAYRRYQSRSQLAWFDRQGRLLQKIGPAGVNLKQGRLSPDGRKIAAPIFDVEQGMNHVWIIDTADGAARQLSTGPGLADTPVWSPNSGKVAYNAAYDSPPKVRVRGIGENDPVELMPEDYYQVPSGWSPDGRFLAYTNASFPVKNELKGDVWLIDLERGRKVVPLIHSPFHETEPAFSPDGRWLAFTSDESGQNEVYAQAFEGGESPRLVGERYVVSRNGATALRWARSGKELFYLAWDGRIYSVPITFAPRFKAGPPVPLFAISTEARASIHGVNGFDVSADGQRLLVPIVNSPEKSEIVVIQNWESLVRKNAPAHD